MDERELQVSLTEITGTASSLLRESLTMCVPLYKETSLIPEIVKFVVVNLFTSCYSTSESSMLLIRHYRLWDAHILFRSILEGTIKLLFITHGEEQEIVDKCVEFWHTIPEMKRISRHKKALSVLDQDRSPDNLRPFSDLLLSDEELKNLEIKYPKRVRQVLDNKWSYSVMVKKLSENKSDGYDSLISTYHDYGIGSHLTHHDGDAIGVMYDRNKRSQDRRISLELAHGVRMVEGLLNYAVIRNTTYFKIHKFDCAPLISLKVRINNFTKELDEHYKDWMKIEYGK